MSNLSDRYFAPRHDFETKPPHVRELTARQATVVKMICDGYQNKQIAEILNISLKTVETHRAQAMARTRAPCIALLVRWAVRNGLVEA